MLSFLLGTILGMFIMYKICKCETNFTIKYNIKDEEKE